MKSQNAIWGFCLTIVVLTLTLGGCSGSDKRETGIDNIYRKIEDNSDENKSEKTAISGKNESSVENVTSDSAKNVSAIPSGGSTILVGLDGIPIYTSEITEVYDIHNKPTTVDRINKYVDGVTVICDGFQYFKQPEGTAYDNYNSPEFFEGTEFIGEKPENNTEWIRVNVGDEICGLKLVSAAVRFEVSRYYDNFYYYTYGGLNKPNAEFEGTVTVEGFMSSSARNPNEPNGGSLRFTPTENKLPLMGNDLDTEPVFRISTAYETNELLSFNETGLITIDSHTCDTNDLGIGDIAYVRATLSGIKYRAGYIVADLDEMELLSDVIVHIDDTV